MTTDPLIEACRKLLELEQKATPGKWEARKEYFSRHDPARDATYEVFPHVDGRKKPKDGFGNWSGLAKCESYEPNNRSNAALIAAMRNAIRELAQGYINRTEALEEQKQLAERFLKERQGAMHSNETWELMHAKRHEELEVMGLALKNLMDVLMRDVGTIPELTSDCAKAWKRCKAALANPATTETPKCRRCDVPMEGGIAIKSAMTDHGEGLHVANAPLSRVWKCPKCGHSFTQATTKENQP